MVTFKQIMKLGMSQMPAYSYVVIRSLFDEDQPLKLTPTLTADFTLQGV
jgi:hypothetical protein